MITDRCKLILISFGLSLFIASLLQIELIYFISAALASMLLVSFVFFLITPLNITCLRKLPNVAYEDELQKVNIQLVNSALLGSYFIYVTDVFTPDASYCQKKELVFPYLGGRKCVNEDYEGFCFKRGRYFIGPLSITISDPLGLFKKSRLISEPSKFTVYPNIFNISSLTPFNRGMVTPRYGSQTARRSGDYEEFFGIRQYQQEDGLRKIHWPSSAKRNQLIVRHFEQTGINTAVIMLDLKWENNLGSGKETTLEYAVKIAASAAKYFLEHNYSLQLLAYGQKPLISAAGKDYSHLFTVLEHLAQAEANGHLTLSETMDKLNYLIPAVATMLVIRLDNDADTAKTLEKFIYTKGVSLVDVQLVSSSFNNSLPRQAPNFMEVKGSDVVTYVINQGDNLELKFFKG